MKYVATDDEILSIEKETTCYVWAGHYRWKKVKDKPTSVRRSDGPRGTIIEECNLQLYRDRFTAIDVTQVIFEIHIAYPHDSNGLRDKFSDKQIIEAGKILGIVEESDGLNVVVFNRR